MSSYSLEGQTVEINEGAVRADLATVIMLIFLVLDGITVALMMSTAVVQAMERATVVRKIEAERTAQTRVDTVLASARAVEKENAALDRTIRALEKKITDKQKGLEHAAESFVKDSLGKSGLGANDIDIFFEGLAKLPGDTIHIVVDASRSMRENLPFLIAFMRAFAIKSGKKVSHVTWYQGGRAQTYSGEGAIAKAIKRAPWGGAGETARAGLVHAARAATPSAYVLISDQPSSDGYPHSMPAPVFALPLVYEKFGLSPEGKRLLQEQERFSTQTGGGMIKVRLF